MNLTGKTVIIAGALALILGSGISLVYYFEPFAGDAGKISAKTKTQKQLWTCSMHPQVLKDKPGLCPICHMELTPVKSHNHTTAGDTKKVGFKDQAGSANNNLLIRVEPGVIQKMGVSTEIVKEEPVSREIRAVAHVEFSEINQAIINSRVNGWVEKLYARYTGQKVRRGQALAAIYSPELVSTQEEYLQLYKKAKLAGAGVEPVVEPVKVGESGEVDSKKNSDVITQEFKPLLDAARKRLRLWNISAAQIKRIEQTGKVRRLLTLYSPYTGVITEKKVIQGAHIKEGTDLFKIVDLSQVWAFVHIPEKEIPFIKEGMPAEMIVPQLPGKTFKGKVSFIFSYMDPKARDLKVRVSFNNPRLQLRPGMYATIILKRTLKNKFVLAPSSSIIRTGTREIVFVYKGQGVFEPRKVRTGVSSQGDKIQIIEGLKAGEAVVVSGQFLLDSESRIQEAVQKLRQENGTGSDAKNVKMPGGHNH